MPNVAVLDVIADVAQIVRRAPNTTLIGAYVRAARKFCRESRWFRSTLIGQTVADTQLYSLGTDPALEVLGLRAVSAAGLSGNVQSWPLNVQDPTSWNPNVQTRRPQAYAYVPEGQIALYPTPDQAYSLTMTLVLQPRSGATEVPEELLVKWDQALQDGALAYLFGIPGQPWSDPVRAQLHQRAFQAAINNAKADEQRAYNQGSVAARRRAFLVGGI